MNNTIIYLKNRPDMSDKFRKAYTEVENNFNEITDNTLIDALCFEKKALDCKLAYILKEMKEDDQADEAKENKNFIRNVLTLIQFESIIRAIRWWKSWIMNYLRSI